MPDLYFVMTASPEIVAASDTSLQITTTTRDRIVGRSFWRSLADFWRSLAAMVKRVLWDKRPDALAIQSQELRHWSRVNARGLGAPGEVVYIMRRVKDAPVKDAPLSGRRTTPR